MKRRTRRIGLWRSRRVDCPLKSGTKPLPLEKVFPSGRQALSHSLTYIGLRRANRVAFPEWSSHCVLSAIGRVVTPIPFNEVVEHKMKVDGVLLYEQWGWPFSSEVIRLLREFFYNTVLILDMVDSAHFNLHRNPEFEGSGGFIQIASLSKLLGLPGGGVVTCNGECLNFERDRESEIVLSLFERSGLTEQGPFSFSRTILKDNVAAIDSGLKKWLQENDLLGAIEYERVLRQQNLEKILNNSTSDGWPTWMREAVEGGAGPGIAPLLKGYPDDVLTRIQKFLLDVHRIETSIYHFDWSGNPLTAQYEKCLAFPVHGMVQDLDEILRDILVR